MKGIDFNSADFEFPMGDEYNNSTENEITIFPNPNNGSFIIEYAHFNEIKQIQIVNPLGEIVYDIQNPKENSITLPAGAKGSFFVRIMTSKEIITKKIVVQ